MNKKVSLGERLFDISNVLLMLGLMIATFYPILYVVIASLSNGSRLIAHQGLLLWPQGFSLDAYKAVLLNPSILQGYKNTLFIVIVGVAINLVLTSIGAYFLSRDNVFWKAPIMMMIVFTMFFSGGLVPFYLTVRALGLYDSIWALIVPGAISTFNLIIMRTYFQSIPKDMEESAVMDGAGHFTILFRVYLPLAMPVVAVMILYYGVGHWNSWFNAMVFLRNHDLYPLQLILRNILIDNDVESMMGQTSTYMSKQEVAETVKYAAIMVSIIPILLLYPYVQKYFVKGVMIGALKG
ncbi:carbohydrate ABC transporter permease [Paenibacillus periandrae]|uniref:carbohydrate ABC transporter permease n=1 Tax=Paenibacillus periandrae TaxID=1761741 RepID=UPI001F08B3A9|nr:carbohydrate ABC transporter permease [Paenibacillus periandrae]